MSTALPQDGTAAAGPAREELRLDPWDEPNRRLVENVHPPRWTNPTPKGKYDLVVLGAGTGGLVTAAIGAALGARVALIERHLLGGDCLNVGCVPSKAIIRSARAWKAAMEAAERFGGPAATGSGEFAAVMRRMRELRAEISEHDSAARFRDLGVDVFLGEGRFAGRDAVEVAGARLRFRRAVIATGGRAAAPSIPGLSEAGYLTNESVFSLTELPEHLLVIGAGPVGCEMAQSFARFGSRVTVLHQDAHILPRDDQDAARVVRNAMERDGVRFVSSARVTRVKSWDGDGAHRQQRVIHYEQDGEAHTVAGDHLLVAAGRTPNIDTLELEVAGVTVTRFGIETDERLRTRNRRIYAIGDVASRYKFTHAADAQARLVVRNALFFGRGSANALIIPWCTYTSPEVAHVGITAEEAGSRGDVHTLTVPLGSVDRARLDDETDGFLRVHLKQGTDRILGATLVAEHAGDLISQVTQAMVADVGLGTLSNTIFPYPTQAEVLRKAADQWRRTKLTPRAQRAFGWFFRLTRRL
jgi:pyruvate/2-oxoglutarate dehydrogenase complex dihydrolipoamide dehydrogenase (E3) component